MNKKIAIQGIKGCNHHIAAMEYFHNRDLDIVDCFSFTQLAKLVRDNKDIIGIMAIENTIAGSILQNYRLILENGLKITGEYKLRIKHALAVIPGVKLSDIREVNSHPMALMQCEDFLEKLSDVKLVETDDTAGSAKWIKDNNLLDHASICPEVAAKIYGLDVLVNGIETNKKNYTRFLILSRDEEDSQECSEIQTLDEAQAYNDGQTHGIRQAIAIKNKASLVFSLSHKSGSLSRVLSVLSFYDMNLTMIQSIPIIGQEWEYQFYINLIFDDYNRYRGAVDAIKPLTKEFKILGEYQEAK
ncbi:MAG: prephenate dehydratase [Bacteroidales bacterium]